MFLNVYFIPGTLFISFYKFGIVSNAEVYFSSTFYQSGLFNSGVRVPIRLLEHYTPLFLVCTNAEKNPNHTFLN